MNTAILMGRLTADPVVKYTSTQKAFCKFSIAISRAGRKGEADFINCTAWNGIAENMAKYCHKGDRVLVNGSIQTGSYEKDGRKVFTTDIAAWNVTFLDLGKKDGGFKETTDPIPDAFDDAEQDELLPF